MRETCNDYAVGDLVCWRGQGLISEVDTYLGRLGVVIELRNNYSNPVMVHWISRDIVTNPDFTWIIKVSDVLPQQC